MGITLFRMFVWCDVLVTIEVLPYWNVGPESINNLIRFTYLYVSM